MTAILPHPLLSLALAASWLALNPPAGPATWLAAALVGLCVPAVMRALRPAPVRAPAPGAALRFLALVVSDAVVSNFEVAAIILGLRRGKGPRRAGFVHIPLDITDRYGLTVLAIAVTSIPGTIWVDYDSASGRLLLHVLDLDDEAAWVARIKDRYERPLMEMLS